MAKIGDIGWVVRVLSSYGKPVFEKREVVAVGLDKVRYTDRGEEVVVPEWIWDRRLSDSKREAVEHYRAVQQEIYDATKDSADDSLSNVRFAEKWLAENE